MIFQIYSIRIVTKFRNSFIGIACISKDSQEFSKIVWSNEAIKLHVNEVVFQGNSSLPDDIKELTTPSQLFRYFFTTELVNIVVNETNRCALGAKEEFAVDIDDMYHYIGIHLYMSLYRYPNLESYWGTKHAFPPISETMSSRRFETIKKFLSFRNESDRIKRGQPGYDPLFRMRIFAELLNSRFDSVPKTARLCVDEQMCSTKMKHHLRQYMPNKPHKWGIKLFVLCDSFGYAYRFEVYNGAGDNKILDGCPDLGSSANVVVRLSQTIPDFSHYIIYFDNFYTSIPLLVYLRARRIYCLGTIRVNRVPNCMLPTDSTTKNEPRGFSSEFVGTAYGVSISTVLWKDSKSVRLASTYVGVEPFDRSDPSQQQSKAARFDRKQKKYIEIDCPEIIKEYNSHMGGVDLMDGLMGRYHLRAKTRDAATRIFYHFIDMAATNAYILYRRVHAERLKDSGDISAENVKLLPLPEFRESIAAGLIKYTAKRSVGRPVSRPSTPDTHPSTPQNWLPGAIPVGKKTIHPVDEIRLNGEGHFPIWLPRDSGKGNAKGGKSGKQTCKYKNCQGKNASSQCICSICNVHLCCSVARNCFLDYHTKK